LKRRWALILILSLRERSEIMPSGNDLTKALQQYALSLRERQTAGAASEGAGAKANWLVKLPWLKEEIAD
jgi:hypothetical protein